MITVTLASAAGTASIPDDATSGYALVSFSPGQHIRDNAYAESRWLDGAALASSRTDIASLAMTVRVFGTSVPDVIAKVATIGTIINEFDYDVQVTYSAGGSVVYTAMPGSYAPEYDPVLLRSNQALMSLTIPVQP